MRNYMLLVRKDFYSALQSLGNMSWILLIFLLVVCMNPGSSPLMFSILVYTLVISLFSNEENELVCNIVGILPIRRSTAVMARYVYAYLVLLAGFVLGSLGSGIVAAVRGIDSGWLPAMIVSVSLGLVMISVVTPLTYKFGVTKMRLVTMIIYLVVVITAGTIMPLMGESIPTGTPATPVLLLLGAVVLSLLSMVVSVRVSRR